MRTSTTILRRLETWFAHPGWTYGVPWPLRPWAFTSRAWSRSDD